jgi:hypothetical protein
MHPVSLTSIIIRGCIQKFPDGVITKYTLTTINTSWEATQRFMVAKVTRLTHKIAIQLQLVAESCTICNSHSKRPVREFLDTPSYYLPIHAKVRVVTSFMFSNQNILFTTHAPSSHHSYLSTLTIYGEAYKLWSSTLCSLLQSPTTSAPLGPNIILWCTQFSNNLNLRFSVSVRNRVSHPHKTTGKIIILNIVILGSF